MRGAGRSGRLWLAALALCSAVAAGPVAAKGLFRKSQPAAVAKQSIEGLLPAIDKALDESRQIDASRLLDTAYASGLQDPRLSLRSGELQLARQRYDDAVRSFSAAETLAPQKARALQGKGVALASLGRADEAIVVLDAAVKADASLWRAWNALAVERDRRKEWAGSEAAYAEALKAPAAGAFVWNNRGYSRLLQGRYEEASADFISALEKDPGLSTARTNLRLSLALRGDYTRATAGSGAEDRGTVLNNAGFAAVLRGDLVQAEVLFHQAIEARGSSYGRAIENLAMVKALQQTQKAAPKTP